MNIISFNTGIGKLWLEGDNDFLYRVSFIPLRGNCAETKILRQAHQEILEYLHGSRKVFSVPYKMNGTPFQQKVWQTLLQIPYGKTWSYKELAESIHNPGAFRAIGMANHCNPLPIIIPCHRVISNTGDIGGYNGGVDIKKKLLDIEILNSL